MYHVKEVVRPVPGDLDLNVADDEEFSPDKLRANLERMYMTIGLGMLGFINQVARLRSWRERQRTAYFCAVCQLLTSSCWYEKADNLIRLTLLHGSSTCSFPFSPLPLLCC